MCKTLQANGDIYQPPYFCSIKRCSWVFLGISAYCWHLGILNYCEIQPLINWFKIPVLCLFNGAVFLWPSLCYNVITNSVLLSPGTINCLRGAWDSGGSWQVTAGEGGHGGSRRATPADDKFPFTPKKPTHKKGFVGTIWRFFFFFNWTFILFNLKYLTFPLFQMPVWIGLLQSVKVIFDYIAVDIEDTRKKEL